MYTQVGTIVVNTLSIHRKVNSPIYEITKNGKLSECFYNPDDPEIELNDSVFKIIEVAGSNPTRVVDEYDLLVTYVNKFTVSSDDTFSLSIEGKRLQHTSTTTVIDPVVSNVYAYKTALALHITGNIEHLFNKDNMPDTPEARAYLSKMDTITHLGVTYKKVSDSTNNYFVYVRDESNPLDIKNVKVGVVLLYSSKEVPVQEDLETVKYISRKLLCNY